MWKKKCVSPNHFTHLYAMSERSVTTDFHFFFNFKKYVGLRNFDLDGQIQFLLMPEKFTCIDTNTEPLVNQNGKNVGQLE